MSVLDTIASKLSRKTSSDYFLPEIDGFRFYAIFTVLLYHLNTHVSRLVSGSVEMGYFDTSWTYRVMSEGGIGVNVFFAISGFILALPFARQRLFGITKVSLKGYYIRRLTRLEPPYVISLLLFLLVHGVIVNENMSDIFPNFLASLLYLHNIVFDQWSIINPVAWSLEVEVQFYLLAPALAALFSIRNVRWRRAIMVILIIVSMVHYQINYEIIEALHLRKSIFMHLHQFLIGFLFADLFLTDWKSKMEMKSHYFDVIGVASLVLLLVFNEPFNFVHDVIFGICLFLSFLSLFRGKLVNSFFSNRWVVIIGGMCYSIYLLHYALIAFIAGFTRNVFLTDMNYSVNFIIQFIIVIPVVLMISAGYFVLIERPCMDKNWPARLVLWFKGMGS